MDDSATLALGTVLGGLLAIAAVAVVAGAIVGRIREQAGGYWIIGWGVLLMTGALYLAEAEGAAWAGRLAFVTDALFAPLMFMGALELNGDRPTSRWPIVVGAVGGLARVGLEAANLEVAHALYNFAFAPAFLTTAVAATMRARPIATFRLPIACLLSALVVFELWDAWNDFTGHENQILWGPLLLIGVPLAGFQIASRLLALGAGLDSALEASDDAERQLGLERWRKEIVFERVRELVAELDVDARVLFVNGRIREFMGFEPADLIGRRAVEFVPSESRAFTEQIWAAHVAKGGTKEAVVFPVEDRQGDPLYLEISMAEYEFASERRFLVIARDVTHRHRADEERAAYEQKLEAAVAERSEQLRASLSRLREQDRLAAVGTLASGIAHQLNNPVGAISAAAEYALLSRDDEDSRSIQQESLARILDEARRAGRIVKSVLRFARHESTNKWREDLGSVVRRSVELVRPYVSERGGVMDIESTTLALPVLMSPIELEQMVVNLIRNAAESSDRGARIVVSTRAQEGQAVLEVRDDGRGISDEARPQVFNPFYTTRLREGGSGLGLSVVHGIVKDHHGEIEIESEVDKGTCVRIRFDLLAFDGDGDVDCGGGPQGST